MERYYNLQEGVGWDEVGRNGWGGGRCLRKFHNIMQLALSLHQNYSIYIYQVQGAFSIAMNELNLLNQSCE